MTGQKIAGSKFDGKLLDGRGRPRLPAANTVGDKVKERAKKA
ncbi:MAG: hypothetical protein PHP26_01855 [Syntrophomonas sp.]|nr:hypothetical protein [Syntrophomonas sp.]